VLALGIAGAALLRWRNSAAATAAAAARRAKHRPLRRLGAPEAAGSKGAQPGTKMRSNPLLGRVAQPQPPPGKPPLGAFVSFAEASRR
jgi:hypothetical protein